jgi:hypothetical protein
VALDSENGQLEVCARLRQVYRREVFLAEAARDVSGLSPVCSDRGFAQRESDLCRDDVE